MPSQQLFNQYFKNTYKSLLLHIILILFEYYPIIISTFDSPFKIKQSFTSTSQYITNSFNLSSAFPFLFIPNGFSNITNIIFFTVILLFLLIYYTMIYYIGKRDSGLTNHSKPSKIKSILIKLYVNFNDLLFYRYASIFIMLLFSNVIIYYLNTRTFINGIIGIVIGIVFIGYYASMMTHIRNYATVIHICNNAIIQGGFCYPFDYQVSYYYQIYLSILKLIISIEYSAFHLSTSINYILIVINILLIVLIYLSTLITLYVILINKDIKYYMYNREVTFIRLSMIVFNCITIVSIILFHETLFNSLKMFIIMNCFAFIWTIWVMIAIWYKRIIPLWYDGSPILEKMLYIALLYDFDHKTVIYNSSFNMSVTALGSNTNSKGGYYTTQKGYENISGGGRRDDNYKHRSSRGIFGVDIRTVLDTIQLNHQIQCKDFRCKICLIYSNESINGSDLMKLLKYYCKEQMYHRKNNEEKHNFYNEMFMFFSYHFNKKTFIFYSKYKSIISTYKHRIPNAYINGVKTITDQCRSSYDDCNDYLSLYKEVMLFYNFNNELMATLKSTKSFIDLADILKYPCRVFKLAHDINELQRNLLKLTQIVDTKDDTSSTSDLSIKTLKNVYKYNLLINRFIVESLTNEVYHQLNPLDIEALDEYLLSHYQNDKILILSFNFKDQIINPETIIILKSGNEFIKHRLGTFISLFPQKFKENGMNKLVQELVNYIEYDKETCNSSNKKIGNSPSQIIIVPPSSDNPNQKEQVQPNSRKSTKGFSYLTQSVIQVKSQMHLLKQKNAKKNQSNNQTPHCLPIPTQPSNDPKNKYCHGYFEYLVTSIHSNEEFIEYFKYSFSVSNTLINNSLLIHGHYTNDKTNIMIFHQRKSDGLLYLDSFSSSLRNIIQINPQWIDTINASDTPFHITSLFKVINSCNPLIDNEFEYECVFDFKYFYHKVKKFRKAIEEYYNFPRAHHDKNELEAYYQKLKEKSQTTQHQDMKVNLQRRMELNVRQKTYIVFSVHFNTKVTRIGRTGMNDDWKKEEDDILYEYQGFTFTATTTSMNENSVAGSFSKQSDARKNRLRHNPKEEQDQVSHITKTFSVFSWLIILFNCIIIFLCVFFLILQVVKANQITKVNDLFYKFKSVRMFFAHGFVSAMNNICIAQANMDDCINPYIKYSLDFNRKHLLENDYSLRDFIKEELKQKITFLQARFVAFKDNFYLYGDTKLLDLSSPMMTYVLIIQKKDELQQEVLIISFEEALRKYFNSLTVLVNSPTPYDEQTLHIITVNNHLADFSSVKNKNLNEIQREFYQVAINYNNYLNYYTLGEKALLDEFISIKESNEELVIVLMVLIALFNVISFMLCFWNIEIAQRLFMHFISNMITIMGENGFNKLMSSKMKNLIKLSKLYYKNPNDIITDMKKNATKHLTNALLKKPNDHSTQSDDSLTKHINDDQSLINLNNKNNTTMNNIILSRQLHPYRLKIRVLTISYLALMIIVDIVVFITFLDTFLINDYADLNASYENRIYTILALIQMKLILNITENDLAESLGYKTIEADGVINMKIRETMNSLQDIYRMEQKHSDAFQPIGSYYPSECETFFTKVDDPLTKNVNNITGKDYFKFQEDLCRIYDILDLPNYNHMNNEQMLRSQKITNYIRDNSYYGLMTILRSYEYMDLMTMGLMVVRPLRYQLRNVIFDIHLKKSLSSLITVMIIYLSLNIVLDVCIFLFIKFQLAQKLDGMHQNLLLLQKCFQYQTI